jgi:hypothetical protein
MTWFTVASLSEVRSGCKIIAHLRPGVRYRAMDIDEGIITVVGPQGAIGTVSKADALLDRDLDYRRFMRRIRKKRRRKYVILGLVGFLMMVAMAKLAVGILLGGDEVEEVLAVVDGTYVASEVLPDVGMAFVEVEVAGDELIVSSLSHIEVRGGAGCGGFALFEATAMAGEFDGDRALMRGTVEASSATRGDGCCAGLYGCPTADDAIGEVMLDVDRQAGTVGYRLTLRSIALNVAGLELLPRADGVEVGDLRIVCDDVADMHLNGLFRFPNGDASAVIVWTEHQAFGASGSGSYDGSEFQLSASSASDHFIVLVELGAKEGEASIAFASGKRIEECVVHRSEGGH